MQQLYMDKGDKSKGLSPFHLPAIPEADKFRVGLGRGSKVYCAFKYQPLKHNGGPDGELGAALRYLSQRFTMVTPQAKAILNDIGTEEYAPSCYQ